MSFKTFKQQNEEQDGSVLIKLLSDVIVERIGIKPNYDDEAIKDASIIFMDVVLDKMHDLQIEENIDFHTSCNMAEQCGTELRTFIKKWCNINMMDFANK